jgi:hypothetical protein
MVKKVQYELIDTNVLPLELIGRANAVEQFVGVHESFTNEWVDITTRLSVLRQELSKGYVSSTSDKKSDLYISFVNNCGMILVEDNDGCSCTSRGCNC